jgi:DNA polymerase (family 10)
MDKYEIAAVFYEIADLLDLQGVAFKPQAYRRAARNIEQLEEDIAELAADDRLKDIPGVGDAMAKKILEMVDTGKLRYLEELRGEVPPGLVELLSVPDVGPKTAMILYKELGISSVEQLKQAVMDHRLHGIKGFGEKSEEKILQGIRTLESKGGRTLLGEALPIAEAILGHLTSSLRLDRVGIGGSLRRGKETVGDIDLLVGDDDPAAVMDKFVSYPDVKEVLMKGPTKSSVRLRDGLQVDIRAVEAKSFGAALQYFTGSKEHNVALRRLGAELGFKLNEYGLFERDSGKMVAGATEEEVYEKLGLRYIPPEIRENNGEIEASREGRLPELVEQERVRGDFHVHTNWSDGGDTIKEVVAAAVSRGYEFVAITDHSQSLRIANGLSPERLAKQIEEVRKAGETAGGRISVLAGSEVDIKADGSLDFPKALLSDLDIVIASVHSRFKMEKAEMTRRIVAAVESGSVDILGHPTGRLIGQRVPYEFDIDQVLDAARSAGVAMEVNSFPDRLDLNDANCRLAKQHGVKVAIGTDSHSVDHMDHMRLGVITARRGWLENEDVLNTLSGKDLAKHFHRRTA